MSNTYYKVLSADRRSVMTILGSPDLPAAVTYHREEWTKPVFKGTPLMVFESAGFAHSFVEASGFAHSLIVECRIKPYKELISKIINFYAHPDALSSLSSWETYMEDASDSRCESWDIPMGTVLASEVFCLT